MERVMGSYTEKTKGPLLVVIGGIHGNEPAGVKAIDFVCKMLEVEHIKNENFNYNGSFLGIIGNLKAFKRKERFIDRDLNRMWRPENVAKILNSSTADLINEEIEIKEILDLIHKAVNEDHIDKLIVLDLHTTSSTGGIFTIPSETNESEKIAMELHAPMIKGMLEGINGTTLHYFKNEYFSIPTTAVTFESGQHLDPLSVNRAVSAIINCMRTIGSVQPSDVENIHDKILKKFSSALPKKTNLIERFAIEDDSEFSMYPGFQNFQRVQAGEIIAKNKNGDIRVSADGLLLMPLYQKKGEDGFFLIKEVE